MNELILIAVSLFASTLAGIAGMGGGILLISVMAALLPPPSIVPIHEAVMLASNATRALFGFRYMEWRTFRQFLCGGVVGAAIGSRLIKSIPPEVIPLLLGCFILIFTWMPTFKVKVVYHLNFSGSGGFRRSCRFSSA